MPAASLAIDIGTLITTHPGIHNGCPIVAGTGVTVRRIASELYLMNSCDACSLTMLKLRQKTSAFGNPTWYKLHLNP